MQFLKFQKVKQLKNTRSYTQGEQFGQETADSPLFLKFYGSYVLVNGSSDLELSSSARDR